MTDFNFETQAPYTPPPGDEADFQFNLISFYFQGLDPLITIPSGTVDFTWQEGGDPVIVQSESSSAQGNAIFSGVLTNEIAGVQIASTSALGNSVFSGLLFSTVEEVPVTDLQSSSAELLAYSSGVLISAIAEISSQSSSATLSSVSFGSLSSSVVIQQSISSSAGTLNSRWTLQICSSIINVKNISNQDYKYRSVVYTDNSRGVVDPLPRVAQGTVELAENTNKLSKFKASYIPFGNVYEAAYTPPSEYKFYYLNSALLMPLIKDSTTTSISLSSSSTLQDMPNVVYLDSTSTNSSVPSGVMNVPEKVDILDNTDTESNLTPGSIMTSRLPYDYSDNTSTVPTLGNDSALFLSIQYSNYDDHTDTQSNLAPGASLT
jgi:hypothetical protein